MKILLVILYILMLMACEKAYHSDVLVPVGPIVVVDGIVTDEIKIQRIKLSLVQNDAGIPTLAASGALISVKVDTQQIDFIETPIGSGNYLSEISFGAVLGKVYQLNIIYQGKTYQANASMVAVTALGRISYDSIPELPGFYKFTELPPFFEETNPSMYEFLIDWSILPAYASKPQDSCIVRMYSYTLSTIDVAQSFAPPLEKINFPLHSVVTVRKYSLSPKHEEYIRSMLMESRWRGGYFDEAQANPRTNLSNGAMGFFAVSKVIETKRVVIKKAVQ